LNPPNPSGPTIVDVDVNLEKLKNVNADENTYDARGTLSLVWCDPRLKFDSKLGKYKLINDESANLTIKYAKIWNPQIKFRNGFSPRVVDNVRI